MSPFKQSEYNISNYFLAFCLLEEFLILLLGDKIIFYCFVKYVIRCYLVCNAYLNGFDFLLLFFEILPVLPLIIGIIRRRKYELVNNLK